MVESIYFLKPAWCGTHFAGLWPEQGFQPVTRATALRRWFVTFISSESALQIPVEMIHYGMTKTAQLAISRGLAETTTGTAVTVNAVLPGSTESEGVLEFVDRLSAEKGVERRAFEQEFFQ